MKQTIQLAVIYGSTRQQRRCETVAAWVEHRIDADGRFRYERIDPLDFHLPWRHPPGDERAIGRLRKHVERADAFIVVTPEYNHGYPGALKHLIDCVDAPWRLKPVAFVSYGGRSGGRHAVEQLRQVFNRLDAITLPETIAFDQVWHRFDSDGRLREPEGWQTAAAALFERLAGWAALLRRTRTAIEFHPGPHI